MEQEAMDSSDQQDNASFSSDEPSILASAPSTPLRVLLPSGSKLYENNNDYCFSELDMETLDEDAFYVLMIIWRVIVGLAGLLDCLAGLVSSFLPTEHKYIASVTWLQVHSNRIGMVFSLFWFCDAILSAFHKQKDERLRNEELRRLDASTAPPPERSKYFGVYMLFARLILLQALVLPVGFYISFYRLLLKLTNQPLWDETTDPIVVVHHEGRGDRSENTTALATDTILSGTILIVRHVWIRLSHLAAKRMSKGRARLIRKVLVLLIQLFFQNPLLLHKRIKMTQVFLSWGTNVARVAERLNELMIKTMTVKVNVSQWWHSKLAQRARRKLRRTLSMDSLKEYNATLAQSVVRRFLAQQQVGQRRLEMEMKHDAAIKVQACFRRLLWKVRFRKQSEARKINDMEVEELPATLERSVKYRKVLFELDSEMKRDVSTLINEKMIIAPNNAFSVAWGLLAMFAVLSEATGLTIDPILAERARSDKDLPASFKDLVLKHLIPIAVSEHPQCQVRKERKFLQSFMPFFHHLTKRPSPGPLPWWCHHSTFANVQGMYLTLATWLIHNYTKIIGTILFWDVFVTFFTGKFDIDTGELRPLRFIRRWIVPGIVFQFIVNPHMEPAVTKLRLLAIFMVHRGVLRVYQWCVVSLYPLLRLCVVGVNRLRRRLSKTKTASSPRFSDRSIKAPADKEDAIEDAEAILVADARGPVS
ncbi:hypothetical protein MPSEU_000109500 [Mayamaea pseudoterrestris]|nr:hypothetical protein MPSEU_000109500 [Mayamaea pseudoterrestris]